MSRQPRPRRAHRKSRFGCRTCKERKVKCDETKPVCRNCLTHYDNLPEHYECSWEQGVGESNTSHRTRRQQSHDSNVTFPNAGPRAATRPTLAEDGLSISNRSISSHLLDPFHSYAPSQEPEVDVLMKFYFARQVFSILPYYPTLRVNPISEFFVPLIWKDVVLFHVTMLLSSVELDNSSLLKTRSRSQRLGSECISLLQQRVDSTSEQCISDETLSAVAGLAAIQHRKGNARQARMHLAGLNRILELRGGFNAIRMSNPTVANIVWCILITVGDDPFSACRSEGPVRRPPWLLKALQSDPESQRLDIEACGVASELADAMLNVRILAQQYPTPAACANASEYQDTMSLLTATMHTVLALPESTLPTTHEARITAASRYALTAHVFALWCDDNSDNKVNLPSLTPLHHQPDPSLLVSLSHHNLLTTLRPLLHQPLHSPNPSHHPTSTRPTLLLWHLAVGATTTPNNHPYQKWFTDHFAQQCHDMNLRSFAEVRTHLKKVIWHDLRDEVGYQKLWREVVTRPGF